MELPAPKATGIPSRTFLKAFMEDRGVIFFCRIISSYAWSKIFPRNLPYPMIALGDFERGYEFLTE